VFRTANMGRLGNSNSAAMRFFAALLTFLRHEAECHRPPTTRNGKIACIFDKLSSLSPRPAEDTMEAIDAGDVPLERVVHQLFSDVGLEKLIGNHGVACFVLARSGLIPDFYEQLIRNVGTIDATTRHHIAFIVFYGKKSSILRQPRGEHRLYEHHLAGLSASTEPGVRISEHGNGDDPAELAFNHALSEKLRFAARTVSLDQMERSMDIATSVIMDRFQVSEALLPCLLFVDGKRPHASRLVRLSPDETIKSLHRSVLAPLSDEFRDLQAYWKQRDTIAGHAWEKSQALALLAGYPKKLSELEQSLSLAKSQDAASSEKLTGLKNERDALNAICRTCETAKTLAERIALIPPTAEQYADIQDISRRLVALETEKRNTFSLTLTDEQRQSLATLSSSIRRLRGKLGTLAGMPFSKAKDRLLRVEKDIHSIERLQTQHSIMRKIAQLNKVKADAERQVIRLNEFDEEAHRIQTDENRKALRARGYGDEVLKADRPSAIDVVKTLVDQHRIGMPALPTNDGEELLKILFLAANPRTTTRLDLEGELSAIEKELEAVKHREKITFVARHAVKPDDLVKYIRVEEPDIVHFSGHGTSGGIVLRNEAGTYQIVEGIALTRLLKGRGVKLVILNACFSDNQAQPLSTSADTVIGTTREVGDEAARRFSVAFYRTLGNGHSVGEAFRDGGDAVVIHNLIDVYKIVGDVDAKYVSATQFGQSPG
jgi:hypothetical protein